MSRSDRITVAALGGALVLGLAAALVLLVPVEGGDTPEDQLTAAGDGLSLATPVSSPSASAAAASRLVVDVQGAVAEPGVRELPAGSRVADAIAAAGGYGTDADLAAATSAINLAQPLADGEQIQVPRIGDGQVVAAAADPGASAAAGQPSGLVDLNTATPEELEALPGIGPVTVQKIVAARQEQPFASLEDSVQRGVLNRGQLEDIQGVATAG
ncbi:MAG: SLBB domain-containing protein [Candidatus Limnocylindria bacterium]